MARTVRQRSKRRLWVTGARDERFYAIAALWIVWRQRTAESSSDFIGRCAVWVNVRDVGHGGQHRRPMACRGDQGRAGVEHGALLARIGDQDPVECQRERVVENGGRGVSDAVARDGQIDIGHGASLSVQSTVWVLGIIIPEPLPPRGPSLFS